jgi:ABC-type glycerol-3-phosphate transport system permease component
MTLRKFVDVTWRPAVLIFLSLVTLYPVWFIVQTALKTPAEYAVNPTGLPAHFTLHNFTNVLTNLPVPQWMLNSILVTVTSICIATICAFLAAYAIVFGKPRGSSAFLNVNLAFMAIPPVALLVPMFVLMVQLGLINTLPSVIIFYAGLNIPFSVFFLVSFLREVPPELVEAAQVDGAGPGHTLFKVVFPLSAPAVTTLVLVNSIWVWNELLIALVFLQSDTSRTLMAGLTTFQGRFANNEPLIMAGVFVSILPLVITYILGQRFFIRGLTAGLGK